MIKNGRQQILEAVIRVMSEVGITPPRKDRAMTNITRRQAFHTQLDTIHIEDISLHGVDSFEAEITYVERFGEIPDDIDFDFELTLWQEKNPVCNPADFKAQDGAYIRDTTPLSAEQWEAMHGIGVEPVQDERPVMMISRAIVNSTAGYVGKVGADSVRMWRLYGTPNGETWGAEWSHGSEWTQSTWGTMQRLREWVNTTADVLDIVAEWERY